MKTLTIRQKIVAWVDASGLSDAEFCRRVGWATPYMSSLRTGKKFGEVPTADRLVSLARSETIPMDWLLNENDQSPPPTGRQDAIVLTPAEREVLSVARSVSRTANDPPGELATALRRLHMLEGGHAVEHGMPRAPVPLSPTYADERAAAERDDAGRPRNGNRKSGS